MAPLPAMCMNPRMKGPIECAAVAELRALDAHTACPLVPCLPIRPLGYSANYTLLDTL